MQRKENKEKIFTKMQNYLEKYRSIVICEIKDLPADMIHRMRKLVRELRSEIVCGKTTVMGKAISDYITEKTKNGSKLPQHLTVEGLNVLSDTIKGMQILIIFTNEDLGKVTAITEKFMVEKQAKVGAISPIEVILPAGSTGMDSSQIEYFQALKIPTKVIKNQLEIVSATKILAVGQKISLSEINLMKKFNIKPYKHFVQIQHIYMNGKLYDKGILKITDEYMKARLDQGIQNIAALSLRTNVSNKASAPHIISQALSKLVGLSLATGVQISQIKTTAMGDQEGIKKEPKGGAPKKEAPPKKEEPKKEEPKKEEPKKEEPQPEEDIGGFGSLFG